MTPELERGRALGAFLSRASREPFAWGRADCFLLAADWVHEQRGLDPAAEFRGLYDDEAGARRILDAAGGSEALFMRAALASGLQPVEAPAPGDVGLVKLDGALIGSIRTGRGWAVRTKLRIWVAPFGFVQAWGV